MRVLGITSGVGSLQYGFKQEGFDVCLSHEWRKYYNLNQTFEKNYGQPCLENYEYQSNLKGVDCIVSHPECGNFSNLYTGKNREKREVDPADIYKFIDLCIEYQPKTFLCDNLPKSLLAVSKDEWANKFPDYNIYFEYVSNYGYGNIQKNRNRLFIIGVHKDFGFVFKPKEFKHDYNILDLIYNIEEDTPNHQVMKLSDQTQWMGYQIGLNHSERITLEELQNWLKDQKLNTNIQYFNKSGELKSKPGYSVIDTNKFSPVLSGGGSLYDNFYIFGKEGYYRPLTIRERARIQGFDDDFVFYPLQYEYGSKEHLSLIKQTGKCMPIQFPREFARQLKNFINNGILEETETRLLKQI